MAPVVTGFDAHGQQIAERDGARALIDAANLRVSAPRATER